jgi:regulator of protease activity HflC (stomatin/prohibitin superfamily)
MDNPITFFGWFAFAILAFIVLSTILGSFFTVNTAQVAVITRFGRFLRVANPGLNWKYKLSNPAEQIQAYVEQVILGHVPGMTLDEVFASQSGIAAAVKQELDAIWPGSAMKSSMSWSPTSFPTPR